MTDWLYPSEGNGIYQCGGNGNFTGFRVYRRNYNTNQIKQHVKLSAEIYYMESIYNQSFQQNSIILNKMYLIIHTLNIRTYNKVIALSSGKGDTKLWKWQYIVKSFPKDLWLLLRESSVTLLSLLVCIIYFRYLYVI